ncbi:Fibronectin type III domain protein, partial [Trichostrongylus colubriformis]
KKKKEVKDVEKPEEKAEPKEAEKPEEKAKPKEKVEKKKKEVKEVEKLEEKAEPKEAEKPEEKVKPKEEEKPKEKVDKKKKEVKEVEKPEEKAEPKEAEKPEEKAKPKEEEKPKEKVEKKKKEVKEVEKPEEKAEPKEAEKPEEKAKPKEEEKPKEKVEKKRKEVKEVEKPGEKAEPKEAEKPEEKAKPKEEDKSKEKVEKKKKVVEKKKEEMKQEDQLKPLEKMEAEEEPSVDEEDLQQIRIEVTDTHRREADSLAPSEDGGDVTLESIPDGMERISFEDDALSSKSSRRSSGTSSIESYTVSRRRMRKEGFISTPGAEVLALRGDTVRFECELVEENDEVEWFINDKPFTTESRSKEDSSGPIRSLIITDLKPEDTGMIVEVRLGSSVAKSKVTVEETFAEIVKRLERRTVGKENEPVVLRIELDHPAKDVKWTKDDKVLTDSEKYDIVSEGTSCRLTIRNADFNDAGQYVVEADGSKSYTNLHISGKPRIKPGAKELIEVERDENIMLSVGFDCQDDVIATCFLNGSLLREDAKTKVDVLENLVKFCKRQVTKADSGEYTVKLSNEHGEATEVFNVKVKDVPGPPASVYVNEIDSESISISWEKPSDDGGQPITGYVIDKKEDGRRTFHKVAHVSGVKTTYTVEDLEMLTGYILRVAAVNKYGTGEPVETSVITTGTSFKAPQITEQPTISDVTSNSCVLKWNKPQEDGGSPIYGYDVYLRENGGEWTKISDELVFANRYVVGNLHPDVSYEFKVEAVNEAGLTSSSNVSSETLLITSTLDRPTATLDVPRIAILAENSANVEWDEYKDELSTEYTVAYKSEGSSIWTEINTSSNFCSIADLKEGVSYVFKVALRNQGGIGEYSDETEPVKVTPKVPPVIIKPIRSATIPKKRTLQLECHATAEPAPEYIWYKDGVEIIPQNANTEIINEGYMSLFKVHSVSESDAGSYTCEVENPHGSSKCTATVVVTDVRCHFESSFSEYIEVIEGQDIELSCTLSDEDGVVVWYKDGKVLHEDDRVLISADGTKRTLKVLKVKDIDNGTYRCETSDGRSRTEGELVVKEEEPHISIGPQDLTVDKIGSDAKLHCMLTRPAHKVLWYKNGQEIWPQANKYVIINSGNTSLLEIRNVDKHDVGEYTAALNEKEVSAPAHLKLEVAPEITIQEHLEDEVVFNTHAQLAFHVEVTGYPTPTVTILHRDSRIQNRASVEEYDNIVSVRMKNLSREDCGTVKITAENEIGAVHKEICLTVLDVPSEPLGLTASQTTTESTVLSWNNPEKTNGAPITGFIIERKAVDSNRWRPVGKTTADTTRFEAKDLFSSQVYGFRVIALNSVGEGPPSHSIDVLTNEDEEYSESSLLSVLDTPDVPEANLDGAAVQLSWRAVPDANVYHVERQHDEGDWQEIAKIDGTNFVDSSMPQSGSYRYRVLAKGLTAESRPSDSTAPLLVVLIPDEREGAVDSQSTDQLNGQAHPEELVVEEKAEVNGEPAKAVLEYAEQTDGQVSETAIDGAIIAPDEADAKKVDKEKKEEELAKPEKAEEAKKKKVGKKKVKEMEKEDDVTADKEKTTVALEVEQKAEDKFAEITEPKISDSAAPADRLEEKKEVKKEIKVDDVKKEEKEDKAPAETKEDKKKVKKPDDKKKDEKELEADDQEKDAEKVKAPEKKKEEKEAKIPELVLTSKADSLDIEFGKTGKL